MPNEITQEQATVKIAEFLGLIKVEEPDYSYWYFIRPNSKSKQIDEGCLINWLSSPEGEVAMGNKVREIGYYLSSWSGKDEEDGLWASVTLTPPDRKKHIDISVKTYNAALQLAILKMLEGKK